MNYVTQNELKLAKTEFLRMNDRQIASLQEVMAEQDFERRAAFGQGFALAACIVEETGEPVAQILYELCYKARITKLFEERDKRNLAG